MIEMPSPVAFLGLPLWLGPPVLLIIMVTRVRVVRITFGVGLVVALTFLFAIACQLLQGQGLPNWSEGLVLWGPTTLALCAIAVLADGPTSAGSGRTANRTSPSTPPFAVPGAA
ncbi:hypothetical protein [Plantactinospora sp. KLBMP9567]|uniref:hypothetical protein n=1 Tax=Plantactinospora sp. KLBMP9567 TaxID=3085900 RepID=UPI00298245E7|nr:hypothetical protein [Plantactinospora sp. KLBMP9567]MDW5330635.1 hypothetical protein [Plantactinospora sp. KLBMP9567]